MPFILCFANSVKDKSDFRNFLKDCSARYNREYYEMFRTYLCGPYVDGSDSELKKMDLYLSLKKIEFLNDEDITALKIKFPELVIFNLDSNGTIPDYINFKKKIFYNEENIKGYIRKSTYTDDLSCKTYSCFVFD